ncbi:MAG TPA: AAA family ATPase, partial [Vicinamibacteria bacterium]
RRRVLPRVDALRDALAQLAAGAIALHAAGKLHCDIKPLNVRVTPEGRVVLLDFGLVSEGAGETALGEGGIAGTVPYMSPEQGTGGPMTPASDWYSVGAMLYEALTGTVPFHGTVADVLRAKQQHEPPPPSRLAPATPGDLDEICQGLLRRDPERRLGGAEVLTRLGRRTVRAPEAETAAVPLIGREAHLRALEDAFAASRAGRAVVVYVRGAPGVGKTALVQRFQERLRERREAVVLSGRCFERESVPYKALDTLVEALARHLDTPGESHLARLPARDAAALARIFPVLTQVPGMPPPPEGESASRPERRRRAVGALRELFRALAARRPLVLAIDDLQWGDLDSARLLGELLAVKDPPPLLLLAAHRTEPRRSPFLDTFHALAERARPAVHSEVLPIAELSVADGEALARALLRDAAPGLTDAIARESGGNALFISELARHSKGSGMLEAVTFEGMIRARVGRLPLPAQRLLEVVSVAARPVLVEVARTAAGGGPEDQPALAQLRAADLVRLHGPIPRLEVAHDRIREVVVGALEPEALRERHLHLARALEASGRGDDEALAVHFHGAGDPERAAGYAAGAAAQSAQALAFDRAARLFRLALELRGPAHGDAPRLQVDLAEALANAGRGGDAGHAYAAAAARAPEAEALELRRRAAEQFLRAGHVDLGLEAIVAVLRSLGMGLARSPRRALVSLMLRRLWLRVRGLEFRERDAGAVPPGELIRIDACWSVAIGLSLVDTVRAADFQARHLLRALRAGEPYRIARALALESGHSAAGGAPAQARTQGLVTKASRLAERLQHPHALGLASSMAGLTACLEGRFQTALARCDEAARILRERCTGVAQELDTAHSYALMALSYLGETRELARRLPALRQDAADRGDLFGSIRLRTRGLCFSLLAADDPEQALSEVEQAIATWSQRAFHNPHYNALWARATVALYRGDGGRTLALLKEHGPALRRSMVLRAQFARIEVLWLRARGALAAAVATPAEDPAPRLAAAGTEARRLRGEGAPWANALAGLVQSAVCAWQGDRARAVLLLEEAGQAAGAAHMGLHAAAARRRRGELIGGADGEALVREADAWMRGQDVRDPGRMAALIAPGRWS